MDVTRESLELFFNSLGFTNALIYVLILTLALNILATLFRFALERRIKDREKWIYRGNLINERAVEAQEVIYTRIERLSLFTRGEEDSLLEELQSLQRYISSRGLYLNESLQDVINESLDYFRKVLTDYRQKDLSVEQNLLKSYAREFHK